MRTIFAMGGGGFTMQPDNPVLDEFILGLARRPVPRVCFLPTASGDPLDHITRFYEAFSDLPCEATDLSLFRLGRRPVDLRRMLLAQDVVYVGGGSLRNMLAIWRVHDLDTILHECWMRGVVLAGLSAGASSGSGSARTSTWTGCSTAPSPARRTRTQRRPGREATTRTRRRSRNSRPTPSSAPKPSGTRPLATASRYTGRRSGSPS